MSDQGTFYNTVMSYVPGTEDYKKASQHSEEEHHSYKSAGAAGNAVGDSTGTGNTSSYGAGGNTVGDTTGTGTGNTSSYGAGGDKVNDTTGTGTGNTSSYGTGTGATGQGSTQANYGGSQGFGGQQGSDYTSTGEGQGQYGQGSKGSGAYDRSATEGQQFDGNAGQTYGSKGTQGSFGSGSDTSGVGGSNLSTGTGTGTGGNAYQKPNIEYEDDVADDTGTHHSGYNPQAGSTAGMSTQTNDDGVRGAPIEGENVKGYAIGSQVGSGDTENPTRPGDPSGQVAGSHVEYGPKETDTRDAAGRGTVGQSKGTGDSSFANVKTDDGMGNSSHVVTRQSTSHMQTSTTTQL